ncbi:hypothetical protein GCM10011514_07310 [Emticicia aquatilis]|uniref:Uncharacterized protein n=1 Tax=Emticicia aquatilis TaxID=1537369 RepID=A0A916YHG8_9BACT|nr:hypothetical protein [Emticicia aquatilis]GGD45844.1 hypothetical protein GCM10011514_07310 [Emticicia aquatilis]
MSNRKSNTAKTAQATKLYLLPQVDKETGEEIFVPKYKYIPGSPKQYRYNSQNGQFNINGERILLDGKGSPITQFSFQPIAWRIFEAPMFGRDRADKWCEIFFIDDKNCVSCIMFNNTTLEELNKLAEQMFYDDITLADIVLTMKPEKIESKTENKSWYIGRFSYDYAEKNKVAELQEFANDYPIFRRDTITETAIYLAKSENFHIPPKAEVLEEAKQAA